MLLLFLPFWLFACFICLFRFFFGDIMSLRVCSFICLLLSVSCVVGVFCCVGRRCLLLSVSFYGFAIVIDCLVFVWFGVGVGCWMLLL